MLRPASLRTSILALLLLGGGLGAAGAIEQPDPAAGGGAAAATPQTPAGPEVSGGEGLPKTCLLPPAKVDDSLVDAFLSLPDGLLARHPDGGIPMVRDVRGLAGSDARTIDPLLDLIPIASEPQKAAIGAGLARAALACARLAPDYAAFIQEKVAATDDLGLLTAFAQAAGDIETTAVAGIPGGPPGSVAAPGINGAAAPGGGSRVRYGDSFVVQTVETYRFFRRDGVFGPIGGGRDVSSVSNTASD